MGMNGRYRICDTCGATGHRENSELCPYRKTQDRQDPFGLEKPAPRRRRNATSAITSLLSPTFAPRPAATDFPQRRLAFSRY
jgi:hypothetical protein